MKYCKDCKHFQKTDGGNTALGSGALMVFSSPPRMSCGYAEKASFSDPVTGEPALVFTSDPHKLRDSPILCGPDAQWFEPLVVEKYEDMPNPLRGLPYTVRS